MALEEITRGEVLKNLLQSQQGEPVYGASTSGTTGVSDVARIGARAGLQKAIPMVIRAAGPIETLAKGQQAGEALVNAPPITFQATHTIPGGQITDYKPETTFMDTLRGGKIGARELTQTNVVGRPYPVRDIYPTVGEELPPSIAEKVVPPTSTGAVVPGTPTYTPPALASINVERPPTWEDLYAKYLGMTGSARGDWATAGLHQALASGAASSQLSSLRAQYNAERADAEKTRQAGFENRRLGVAEAILPSQMRSEEAKAVKMQTEADAAKIGADLLKRGKFAEYNRLVGGATAKEPKISVVNTTDVKGNPLISIYENGKPIGNYDPSDPAYAAAIEMANTPEAAGIPFQALYSGIRRQNAQTAEQ